MAVTVTGYYIKLKLKIKRPGPEGAYDASWDPGAPLSYVW